MTLGLVAAAPNVGLAGPFDFFRPKPDATADGAYNQQVAEQVAGKLRAARLSGADIEIEFQDGVLTLKGQVADAGTKALASQLGQSVGGVQSVNNQMTTGSAGPIQQVAAQAPASRADANPFAPRSGVQAAAFESSMGQPSGIQQVAAAQAAARNRSQSQAPAAAPAVRRPAPPAAAPAASGASNQQAAEQVAMALKNAGLSGYDIQVRCDGGVCTLAGTVSSPMHRDAAIKAASQAAATTPAIKQIDPQLRVAAANPIMPASFQEGGAVNGMPPGMPLGMPPGYGAPPAGVVPPPPGWAQPGASPVGPVYDQPGLPQHAWPSYAQYPNYAAVTYPRQYSASAWPYIGPFYPYPQVPLGWREVTLEWDDGHWFLDFNDRTDKWWWFMNPKNW